MVIRKVVLVVDPDRVTRAVIKRVLESNEVTVVSASDDIDAVLQLLSIEPDLMICNAPDTGGAGALPQPRLRSHPKLARLPVIYLTEFGRSPYYGATANGCFISRPIRPPELVARVRQLLAAEAVEAARVPAERRRAGRSAVATDVGTSYWRPTRHRLLNEADFEFECAFDLKRGGQRRSVAVAYLELFELDGLRDNFGDAALRLISYEILTLAETAPSITRIGRDGTGRFLLLLRGTPAATRKALNDLSRAIVAHRFHLASEPIRLTPLVGYALRTDAATAAELRAQALVALGRAEEHHDLQAVRYDAQADATTKKGALAAISARAAAAFKPLTLPLQIVATSVGCFVIPFATYCGLAAHGVDVSDDMYLVCVAMLALTAAGIIWESVLALKDEDPPSAGLYPTASAIIAAYLPNEAGTVIETVEAFLRMEYAGEIQIILAYNTPYDMPMEEELRAIGDRDPRFVPMRVFGSTSKAQNVNAALRTVRGAFVGVFDADHKPDPGSFTRAWDWLASGYDIVQGHCLIRNGTDSLVAQIVAVEFESIYAVSHPGRERLHGFGLFGGSNGYWKTDLLRQTRMHHFMLTEDIDSSLRVVEAGYHIKSDRKLISRELAPLTLRAFWNQRLRWAQGWFQVSIKHVVPALSSPHLTVRQKVGMIHLLIWRECYVWMSVQILPILAFWAFIRHDRLSFVVPIFLLTTLFTALTGPIQLLFAYLLADPEVRVRRRWFVLNLVASVILLNELKNAITRLAHLKEAMRERVWKVTPRTAVTTPAA